VIIRGRDVLNQVKAELNLQESYEQLAGAITVKAVNNTPIMQIYVRHSDRNTALNITAKLLEVAPKALGDKAEAGSVKPVEQAYAEPGPVSPSIFRNTVLMAFIGCAFTCLIIFAFMLTDNTYKTDLDIQKDLGLPVLGVIPAIESCKGHSVRLRHKKGEKTI
jgi:capsular polysaccharide biosynthesis protein